MGGELGFPSTRRLFSSAEKEFLASQRRVFNDAVVNFLSVRRSMMRLGVVTGTAGLFVNHQEMLVEKTHVAGKLRVNKGEVETSKPHTEIDEVESTAVFLNTWKTWMETWMNHGRFVTVIFCMLALAIQMAVVPKAFESRRRLGCKLTWLSAQEIGSNRLHKNQQIYGTLKNNKNYIYSYKMS